MGIGNKDEVVYVELRQTLLPTTVFEKVIPAVGAYHRVTRCRPSNFRSQYNLARSGRIPPKSCPVYRQSVTVPGHSRYKETYDIGRADKYPSSQMGRHQQNLVCQI